VLEQLAIYFAQKILHARVSLPQSIEPLCVVTSHILHEFVHAPVHIGLHRFQSLWSKRIGFGTEFDLLRKVGQILPQEDDEKGHRHVTHALNIPRSRMPVVPDVQQALDHLLDSCTFADHLKFRSNSLHISIDGAVYLLLILAERLWLPVIFKQLAVFRSLLLQNSFSIIDQHILEQVFPDFWTETYIAQNVHAGMPFQLRFWILW
jgi:hypothetical protein